MSLLSALQASRLETLLAGIATLSLVSGGKSIFRCLQLLTHLRKLQIVISTVCYRLKLHPLAKFPGPSLAGLTDWVATYQTLGGDQHQIQLENHKKHGA